jgi:hypothetical protein
MEVMVMEDPAMDQCAHNFERQAVTDWLRLGNRCCPISRKPLTKANLVPNHTLAEQIEKWKWQHDHGEYLAFEEEEEDDDDSDDAATEDESSVITTDDNLLGL